MAYTVIAIKSSAACVDLTLSDCSTDELAPEGGFTISGGKVKVDLTKFTENETWVLVIEGRTKKDALFYSKIRKSHVLKMNLNCTCHSRDVSKPVEAKAETYTLNEKKSDTDKTFTVKEVDITLESTKVCQAATVSCNAYYLKDLEIKDLSETFTDQVVSFNKATKVFTLLKDFADIIRGTIAVTVKCKIDYNSRMKQNETLITNFNLFVHGASLVQETPEEPETVEEAPLTPSLESAPVD